MLASSLTPAPCSVFQASTAMMQAAQEQSWLRLAAWAQLLFLQKAADDAVGAYCPGNQAPLVMGP